MEKSKFVSEDSWPVGLAERSHIIPDSNVKIVDKINYETSEGIVSPNVLDFRESDAKDLREFFANTEYEESRESIEAAIDYVSAMHEFSREQGQDILSLGHDRDGTIYTVLQSKEQLGDHIQVDVSTFNPLESRNITDAYNLCGRKLHYLNPNEAIVIIPKDTDLILYNISNQGSRCQYLSEIGDFYRESNITSCYNLHHDLRYDHPEDQAVKEQREIQAQASSERAYRGL